MGLAIDPLFSALPSDRTLPETQSYANAAIIAIFAYLVPLLTMEINYFRLAVYKSWRRGPGRHHVIANNDAENAAAAADNDNGASAAAAAAAYDNGEADADVNIDVVVTADDGSEDNEADAEEDINIERDTIGTQRATVMVSNVAHHHQCSHQQQHEQQLHINDCDSIIENSSSSGNSSSSSSAVGHLIDELTPAQVRQSLNIPQNKHRTDRITSLSSPDLREAYRLIRMSSLQAITSSLILYALTAVGVGLLTRGLDAKVIAILVGSSQFMASLMVFIVSAKIPQWIGVYHQGAIRLVKCSSSYSQHFERIDLSDPSNLKKLCTHVRFGVWFHFSKFYFVVLPFFCGVQGFTIPLSIISGVVIGFVLMWSVFVVHEKYIRHRNIVSFATIFFLSIISAFTFTRGMAWMQVVWNLDILEDEDTLMVISFFSWLVLCVGVHSLFLWHTLRTEERNKNLISTEVTEHVVVADHDENKSPDRNDHEDSGDSNGKKVEKKAPLRKISSYESYSSFVFDPRTHFKDGKSCQFTDHPDLDVCFTEDPTDDEQLPGMPLEESDNLVYSIETPVGLQVVNGDEVGDKLDENSVGNTQCIPNINNQSEQVVEAQHGSSSTLRKKPRCRELMFCFSPDYHNSSCIWKIISWTKIVVITLAYLLCIYFVIICIGATYQQNATRSNLPSVQAALYDHMNEGPVCAFDNRGPESNITTFDDKEAAQEAGFLVLHCGACGACSTWPNLIVEYATRNNMASLANECAQKALFGGGDDAITKCLMEPEIGFEEECAICWMEDIICTKNHCAFIYLQSQMINNVGNFAVGPDEITSATCEEAHCEVGQFVPCSGATRRRMNIVSSISRPGDQQCSIVDVHSWEDLFYGSGITKL